MSRTPAAQAKAAGPQSSQHPPAGEPDSSPGEMERPLAAEHAAKGPQDGPAETLYLQYGMVRTNAGTGTGTGTGTDATTDAQRGHGTGANQPHTQEQLSSALQERRDEQLRLAESEDHARPDVGAEHSAQDTAEPRDTPPTATEPATIGGLVNPLANGAGNPQTWDHARARSVAATAADRSARVDDDRYAPPTSAEGPARGG